MGRIKIREAKKNDREARIQQAIQERTTKSTSLRDLAILYNVPRSALSDRLRDIPPRFLFCFVLNQLFLSRYMQPVGLWQRQHAAAPRKQETAAFSLHRYTPFLPRTSSRSYVGVSQHLLLPISARKHNPKQKERENNIVTPIPRQRQKEKGNDARYSSAASNPSPPTSPISTSGTSSSSSTPGASAPGNSLLFSLRGGGGDLHPLDACWAIFLATQAAALAP